MNPNALPPIGLPPVCPVPPVQPSGSATHGTAEGGDDFARLLDQATPARGEVTAQGPVVKSDAGGDAQTVDAAAPSTPALDANTVARPNHRLSLPPAGMSTHAGARTKGPVAASETRTTATTAAIEPNVGDGAASASDASADSLSKDDKAQALADMAAQTQVVPGMPAVPAPAWDASALLKAWGAQQPTEGGTAATSTDAQADDAGTPSLGALASQPGAAPMRAAGAGPAAREATSLGSDPAVANWVTTSAASEGTTTVTPGQAATAVGPSAHAERDRSDRLQAATAGQAAMDKIVQALDPAAENAPPATPAMAAAAASAATALATRREARPAVDTPARRSAEAKENVAALDDARARVAPSDGPSDAAPAVRDAKPAVVATATERPTTLTFARSVSEAASRGKVEMASANSGSVGGMASGSSVEMPVPLALATTSYAAAPSGAATDGRIPAPPGTPEFAPQLAAHITTFVRDGLQHARLELSPGEMGPLTVQIQLDGNAAKVHLAAENAQTRQALEQAMPELAGSLRESGLTLSGGGVFEQPRQPQQQQTQTQAGGGHNTEGRGRDERGATTAGSRADAVSGIAAPSTRRRVGMLDLVA